MNERTPTTGQAAEVTVGKPVTSGRYSAFTDAQLDAGLQWLRGQAAAVWSKRLWIEGDYVKGDMRGVPPVVRQMVREQLAAIVLMTPAQYADYWERDVEGRVELVDQVLTEAGR